MRRIKKLLICLYVAGLLVSFSREMLKLEKQIQKEMQISFKYQKEVKNLQKILDNKLWKEI